MEHPEQLLEAIRSPDLIQIGEFGALLAVRKQDDIHLVVVYREVTGSDGFVITAYLAEHLKERTIFWSR